MATTRGALRQARGTSYEADLREVVRQIHEGRTTLLEVAGHLGIPRPRLKEAGAELAQIAGAAKLDGHPLGTSPLARLVEIEGLLLGVRGKLQLWRALAAALEADQLPDDVDPKAMARCRPYEACLAGR